MYYIQSSAYISHQDTFRKKGFSKNLSENISTLIKPDYKEFINPALIRRMSEVLRMSVACGSAALQDAGVNTADAIIAGTGLGCLMDTEKFLNNVITIQGGMLPPTSFIQSTHNTIAGQLSLALSCHSYNMTHTQNSLSFEYALSDAMLMLDDQQGNILAGAADEYIDPLQPVANYFGLNRFPLTSGAGFFVLSDKASAHTQAVLADVLAIHNSDENVFKDFLERNYLSSPDFILTDGYHDDTNRIAQNFSDTPVIPYTPLCGMYATSSAFAMHLAIDILQQKTEQVSGNAIRQHRNALIVNQLLPGHTGLILIKNYEA